MENTNITRSPAETAKAVYNAVTESREVMDAVIEIVKNVNSSINENMATIAAKYQIDEHHMRQISEVRLLKFNTEK